MMLMHAAWGSFVANNICYVSSVQSKHASTHQKRILNHKQTQTISNEALKSKNKPMQYFWQFLLYCVELNTNRVLLSILLSPSIPVNFYQDQAQAKQPVRHSIMGGT